MPLGEFELIERFFSRRTARRDVLLGIGDDAALLEVPAGRALVAATDTLVEGTHFLPGAPARSVGHNALAVNLSDLAAMGAEPAWALLSLSLPEADEEWLTEFSAGLLALADEHGVALVGGDTVRGPRVITVEVLGFVDPSLALKRRGAQPGDLLYVSGSPGESAAGLDVLRRDGSFDALDDPLIRRHLYAEPRIELGRALAGVASAAMDVSDGLLGDLGKLCEASEVGAILELDALPISAALQSRCTRDECERYVLFGGDDYELLFTVAPAYAARVEAGLDPATRVTRIGQIVQGRGVQCSRSGVEVRVGGGGYDHFS